MSAMRNEMIEFPSEIGTTNRRRTVGCDFVDASFGFDDCTVFIAFEEIVASHEADFLGFNSNSEEIILVGSRRVLRNFDSRRES